MRVLKFPHFSALGATKKLPFFALFLPGETLGKMLHIPHSPLSHLPSRVCRRCWLLEEGHMVPGIWSWRRGTFQRHLCGSGKTFCTQSPTSRVVHLIAERSGGGRVPGTLPIVQGRQSGPHRACPAGTRQTVCLPSWVRPGSRPRGDGGSSCTFP